MTLLLFASCHNNDKQQPVEDSTPAEVPPVTVVDTAPTEPTVKTSPELKPIILTPEEETPEETNLRLFKKKQRTIYNPTLMVGEWVNGSRHMEFTADGGGSHWDTDEDIRKEEAQKFHWTMDSNLLTFEHPMTLGGVVIRMFLVTFVDDETLAYRDAYDRSFMWEKAPQKQGKNGLAPVPKQ